MADKPKRKAKNGQKSKSEVETTTLQNMLIGMVVLLLLFGFILFSVVGVVEEQTVDEVVVVTEVEVNEADMAARPPYDRGVVYLSEGRFLAAADAFTAAIELDADNTDARYGRARAYHGAGDFDAARTDYNRLLRDDPDYDDGAWYGLADLYWEQYQRTDEAVHLPDAAAAVEQAITMMEQRGEARPEVYRLAGAVQDELGNGEAALTHYAAYLDVAPVPSPVVAARVAELRRQ